MQLEVTLTDRGGVSSTNHTTPASDGSWQVCGDPTLARNATFLIITAPQSCSTQLRPACTTIIATLCTRTTTRHASATNQTPTPPSTGHAAATARWTFAFQHHRGPCRWASCGCADRRAVWDGVGVRRPGESYTTSPSLSLRICGAKASANAPALKPLKLADSQLSLLS
jgi:hypothetical protein